MKQYIVDAFTDTPFSGNPAAVCVMESWPTEEYMMKLAMENNLSETAYIVKEEQGYHLRWFTPGTEVELCGHATLASSFVILNFYEDWNAILYMPNSPVIINGIAYASTLIKPSMLPNAPEKIAVYTETGLLPVKIMINAAMNIASSNAYIEYLTLNPAVIAPPYKE